MNEIITLPADPNPRVPAEGDFRHIVDLQVRFSDIDMLGHINNNVYLQFMDLGKSRYFNTVIPGSIAARKVEIVVVNINVDFLTPAYLSEPLAVVTAVRAIGEKSLKLEQRIVNRRTGQVKCIGRTVMAGFDPATATGALINPDHATAIRTFEGL